MPSVAEQNAVYLQSGNPDTENAPTLHAPGTLGARFSVTPGSRASGATAARTKRYQLVRLDPTQVAAVVPGAPAYWVDRGLYTVTTVGSALNTNHPAGILNAVITAGNYCCVQQGGPGYPKYNAAPAANLTAVGSAVANSAAAVAVATAPTHMVLGVVSNPATVWAGSPVDANRVLTDLAVDGAA